MAAGVLAYSNREARFQGRPLSAWANDLGSGEADVRQRAQAALERSPEGLAFLSRRIEARPSAVRRFGQRVGSYLPEPLKRPFRRAFDPSRFLLEKHLAAQALQSLGTNAAPAVPALAKMLRDSNVLLASTAGVTLGRIGPAALPVLTDALSDADFNVRSSACAALGQLNTNAASAAPALCAILEHETGPIVSYAAMTLAQIRGPAVPAVQPLLSSTNAATRRWAAQVLGNIGSDASEAIPRLAQSAKDPDFQVRWRVVEALGKINFSSRPAAEALFEALSDEEASVRAVAIGGLVNRPGMVRRNMPQVVGRLQDPSPLVRSHAAQALGRCGEAATNSLPALQELARETNEMVRTAALEAIDSITATVAALQSARAARR